MNNKIISFLIACALVVFLIPGAYAASEDLDVILTKQNPYPVEPDQVVDIEVSLSNTGYGDADNLIFEIVEADPFTLVPGQEGTKTFARIGAQDQVTASYKLYVDKNAISDNYELEFVYYQGLEGVKRSKKVTVSVQGSPKLVLQEIDTVPEEIEPGDTVTITAEIKNVGTGSASFMEATLVPNTTYIVPVLSGGLYYVGEIKPGRIGEAVFEVSVDNSAEYQTYGGVLTLTYNDDSSQSQTSSFSVGLPVRGVPVIEILSAKMDNGAYKVDIENIGTADAKALKVALVQDGEVKDSSIASELRPSKSKTIRFQGFRQGEAVINISYLNVNNEYFANEFPVSIKPSAFSEEAQAGGVTPLAPILIVIVVLESYYIWRLRRKKK